MLNKKINLINLKSHLFTPRQSYEITCIQMNNFKKKVPD